MLIWWLVIAAIVAPLTDVVAFGIHDHVSVSQAQHESLTGGDDDAGPSRHHCELGMTPGVVMDVDDLHVPSTAGPWLGAPPLPPASRMPLVPFGPPRA